MATSTRSQPLDVGTLIYGMSTWAGGWKPPDIIEFVCSDRYLNRPNLYPRQATLLKTIFLQPHLYTDYDYAVLEEWASEYERTENHGIVPDILDRVERNLAEGRKWFRETVLPIGRRGSKGHLGAICGAYVLWHFMGKGDPQYHYGIDRDKNLAGLVFAAKKEQAKREQWRDIYHVVTGAPCFSNYLSKALGETLTIRAPSDEMRVIDQRARRVNVEMDEATFEVLPKESTLSAGRGPAAFMLFFDEMAHTIATGANRNAEDVYNAATPALDQFGLDGFIYAASSPWQMTGKFYELYEEALETDSDGRASYPEKMMVQLTSWDLYEDWELTEGGGFLVRPAREVEETDDYGRPVLRGGEPVIKMLPDIYLPELRGPITQYDEAMKRLERANPETFKVERRGHFATVIDAYLPEQAVFDMFEPWPEDRPLEMQDHGKLGVLYKAHGDPSKSGARFGFAIAHTEPDPEDETLKHVVFDVIHAWDPVDFDDHQLDYEEVIDDIWDYIKRFQPYELTFDQFNAQPLISRLQRKLNKAKLPKRVSVYEKTATAPLNWRRFEAFKTALGLRWIHAPQHDLAELELRFLQEKNGKVVPPETGPVTTKDVADTIVEVTWALIGEQIEAVVEQLSATKLGASAQGGMDPFGARGREDERTFEALSGFGGRRPGRPGSGPARGRRRR